ncbi:MAG: sigma-70 family RNA polymerase sigma factor [Anaerolineales bacterium]|jgi:RNA polymerase primary sigma factor
MVYPGENSVQGEVLDALLEKAKANGHLTLKDLSGVFPRGKKDRRLVELAEFLREQGVNIVMTDGQANGAPEESVSKSKSRRAVLENIPTEDTVSLYLREMAVVPLLSMEEEIELAKRIELARDAAQELSESNGNCTVELITELKCLIQDGAQARNCLIKANTRLVVSVARRYMGRGVPFLDLIQEGNIGLMRAVEKFEYQRGYRFSTYATWWIRQSVTRAIADQGRTIRVPVHMIDRIRQMYKISREMEQTLGRAPTAEELAEEMQLEPAKVRWMLQVAQRPISLESPLGDEDDSEFGMYVEDETSPSPAQVTYLNLLRERLDEALATLSPREARILRLRFGLGHERAYTLEEVGRKFGLTRERIRQIEGKALRRLRRPTMARLLREYLG